MDKENNIIPFNRFNSPELIKQNKVKFYAIPDNVTKYIRSNTSNRIALMIYIDLLEDNCREFNSIPLSDYAALYKIGRNKFRNYLTELEKIEVIKLRKNKMEKNKLTVELIIEKSILLDESLNRLTVNNNTEHENQNNIINFLKAESSYRLSAGIESISHNEDPDRLNNNINNNINNVVNVDPRFLNSDSSVHKNTKTVILESLVKQSNVNIESLVTSTKTLEKPYSKSESKSLGCLCISREKKEKEIVNMNFDENINEKSARRKELEEAYEAIILEGETKRKESDEKYDNGEWNYDEEYKYWESYGKRKNKIYHELYDTIPPENKTIEIVEMKRDKKPKMHDNTKVDIEELDNTCKLVDLSSNKGIRKIYYHQLKEEVDDEITKINYTYDNILIVTDKNLFSIDLYIEYIKNQTEYDISSISYKENIIKLIKQNDKTSLRKYFKKWSKFAENYKNEDDDLFAYRDTKMKDNKKNNDKFDESKPYWYYKHCPQIELLEKYDLSTLQNTFVIYYYMQRKDKIEEDDKPYFYKGIMIQVGAEVFYIDKYLDWTDTQRTPIEHKSSFKDRLMDYVEKKNNDKLWDFYIGFQKYHEEIVVIPREQEKYKEKKQAEEDTNALFAQLDIGLDTRMNKTLENLSTKQKTEYINKFKKDNIESYKIIETEIESAMRTYRRQYKDNPNQDKTIDIIYKQIKKFEKIMKKVS